MAGDETLYGELKRYVRWSKADSDELRVLGEVAAPHFVKIAEEFYDRIREHEDAHAVFTGEEQIERLKRSLVRWMDRLCNGPHDEDYFEERARIGRMHVKIGLPQRFMFTAMALIRASFDRIAGTLPPERAVSVRQTLARALDVELAIMLETYHEDLLERLRRVERGQRTKLERALALSEERFVRAVEQARVLAVGLDAELSITLFNAEAERVSGYDRDEVLGHDICMILPKRLQDEEVSRLRRAAAGEGGPDQAWEAAIETRSGKERLVRWRLAGMPSPNDPDVVVFAIGQDVTEERALVERTLQSERLAAVGTLAAGLAHEIRNPLNGALLHVTYLERALKRMAADPDAMEAAGFIGVEIRRLSTLVKDFLVFARPAPLDVRPTSLAEVCRRVLGLLIDEAARAQVELVADLATTDIVLRIDAGKVEQLLLNLVKNAVEAVAPTGSGRVTLRTRREPRHAVIEVEDDGPGLPSPDAPVFDAFFSTKPQGTGLGLAIVHRVVTDHGGTVEADSHPGRTVFRVTLPIGPSEHPSD